MIYLGPCTTEELAQPTMVKKLMAHDSGPTVGCDAIPMALLAKLEQTKIHMENCVKFFLSQEK